MRLSGVNTTDIADAIRLGCRTMQSVFNADDRDIPFFDSRVRPDVYFGFQCPYQEAHVPGRHLNALLEAESALGLAVDESAIEKHARAAWYSFSGALPLPLNREAPGGRPIVFADHNLREGFHALYALARFRADGRARELAERCIETVFDLWNPETGWDVARLQAVGLYPMLQTFIWGPARAIGPLVKIYRATGYGRALELARLFAHKAVSEFFTESGEFDHRRFGTHTHSATSTLSGLAQLADLLDDDTLFRRVAAFCANGLTTIADELGWVMEHAGRPDWNPDRGECNNTGDLLETLVLLGRRGYPGCWHRVERALRGHLLPAQLRDVSFIGDPPNPRGEDRFRAVADRHRGAFGFPAPYGHEPVGIGFVDFNLDIVGGAVAALCEAWRAVVESGPAGHRVNLLFDRETDAICVESPYTVGALRVTVKRPGPLRVRFPPWVDRAALTVSGVAGPLRFSGEDAVLPAPPPGRPMTFTFDRPTGVGTLKHPTRDIRVRWQGDAVTAMDNFGADLTFFAPFDGADNRERENG